MRILFVSHSLSRTGAPLILLHFLKWVKKNYPELIIDFFSMEGGPLEIEFRELVNSFFCNVPTRETKGVLKRFLGKIFRSPSILEVLASNNYTLIYSNTVVSLDIALKVKSKSSESVKVICHVHELDSIVEILVKTFEEQSKHVDHFIAVSFLVSKMLQLKFKVPKEKISLVYEFSNSVSLPPSCLNKANEQFVVGASGTVHWRKGTDIFLQIAYFIKKNYPEKNIIFKWVGLLPYPEDIIFRFDIEKLGLTEKVEFTGEVLDPFVYYKDFDVFVLTSREDPFPLVCIEVAQLEKPIICFSNVSGTEEILVNGGGKIVPYLDVEEMSIAIIGYYDNPNKRIEDGKVCKKNFEPFTSDLICPQIFSVVEKFLGISK